MADDGSMGDAKELGQLSTKRSLGIPTFEDKVAQRAIAMVLESIYEQDFYPCSYGLQARTVGASSAAGVAPGLYDAGTSMGA